MKPLPALKGGNGKFLMESELALRSNPKTAPRLAPPTLASLPITTVAPQPTPMETKEKNGVAMMPRLFDTSCDETLCSADSFCANDYTWGGSRCQCNLGKGGASCSEGRPLVGRRTWWEPGGSSVFHTWFLLALFLR